MPSRQDQLHSYQYSVQRVVAALVTHDPDPHRSPMRRAGTTALVSLLIAAVAVGAVAIYGVLTGAGGGKPDDPAAVYVEKGTGARFVVSDGKLHPVLNFSSALLLTSGKEPKVISSSTRQLAKVPLGPTLGIPNAPDSLPAVHSLLNGAWSVCTTSATDNAPTSTLLVGDAVAGGTEMKKAGFALLVRDPAGETYLVYENRRFLIPAGRLAATLSAIGMNGRPPWPVATAWLNAVPLGPDLKPPVIADFGAPSGTGDLTVGQLVTNADATQFSVVLADGVSPVTPMQAQLLQTVPGARSPVPLGADFNQVTSSGTRVSDVGRANPLPESVPAAAVTPRLACLIQPSAGSDAKVWADPAIPAGAAVTGVTVPGGVQVDQVHVTRGTGAVVVSSASSTAPASAGTITLVTDTGLRYSVASREALAKLGYGGVRLPQVPAGLVSLLPQGPALDPAQAARPASP